MSSSRNLVREMPKAALERLKNLGVSEEHAKFLSLHPSSVKYFDDIVSLCVIDASVFPSLSKEDAKSVANFVCLKLSAHCETPGGYQRETTVFRH